MINNWFDSRSKCPACAGTEFEKLYSSKFTDPPIRDYLTDFYSSQGGVEFDYLEEVAYELCKCKICDLVFQVNVPNNYLSERLYEKWIDPKKIFEQKKHDYGLEYYSRHAQEIMQIISYFGRRPSDLSFFDFGMGWGKWALLVKAFGCNSYGTELSADRINYAKANGITVISWDDIRQNKFDFINTEQVFEHISAPLATLNYLKEALKPNGIVKISVPTANDILRRINVMDWAAKKQSKNSLNAVAPLEHINCFNRKSLLKLAQLAGMEEVTIPMVVQYRFTVGWTGGAEILRKFYAPISRNIVKRKNYILLRKK